MKIATLVPAYKPQYLVELLTSLRHQTVKPEFILFSDDSPDQAFIASLNNEPLKSLIAPMNVRAVPGPRQGAYNNFRHLLDVWAGETELFHMLLDDDIIYPGFYEQHLLAHQTGRIGCSVSRRWTATESGQPTMDLPVPTAIKTHPNRMLSLTPDVLFPTTVGASGNWLGEFSNAVFAAHLAPMVREPRMDGIDYSGLEDLGAFLNASLRAPLGFLNDHLGYFRTSAQQNSADPMGRPMKLAHLAYLSLAISARRLGQLSDEQAHRCLSKLAPLVAQRYGSEADMQPFVALMPELAMATPEAEARYLDAWHAFLQ